MTDEEYAQVKDAVKLRHGVELLDRECYYIADIIRRLREAKADGIQSIRSDRR
jgi:hypothetical protein